MKVAGFNIGGHASPKRVTTILIILLVLMLAFYVAGLVLGADMDGMWILLVVVGVLIGVLLLAMRWIKARQ